MATDDAVLMKRVAANDETAFAILVQRYQDVLLNFFLRAGVSYTDGQDLAQRTFVRLWQYRTRYRATNAKFTTFLFLMARQVSIDFYRAEVRRGAFEQISDDTLDMENVAAPPSHTDEGPCDDVRRAMSRLPQPLRETVELVVFQDLPYAEAARVLDVPLGTIKSRVFNALEKLRGYLKK